jgi:HAD superfamily hydrolase (TIGR01490 family)
MTSAAFFDLDKTVIAKAALAAYGPPFRRAGMISRTAMLRAMWSQLLFQRFGADEARMNRFRQAAVRASKGWEQAKVSALVADGLLDVIEPIVYDEALQLIAEHHLSGHRVYLVSASPLEIVAPLADYLGVDDVIATRAEVGEDGRYTGEIEFYSFGPSKAEAMREMAANDGVDLSTSYAYSDSATDLPMLEAVGHPIAVNPDRELARVAGERGWEIQHFKQPVPLRSRVPIPESRAVILAAAVTAAVVSGTLVWLWRRPVRVAVPVAVAVPDSVPPAKRAQWAADAVSRLRSPGVS